MDMAVDQTGTGAGQSTRLAGWLNSRYRAGWRDLPGWGLTPVNDLSNPQQRRLVAERRCGCIVTAAAQLVTIRGRWWPYRGNLMRVMWDARYGSLPCDVCELYYHQPANSPNFLTASYVHTGHVTSLATFYAATLVLDEIARVKQIDAAVCHVTNGRISDRLLERWGWQPHCLNWRGRHFIKRFYGNYPQLSDSWRERLTLHDDRERPA